MAGGGEPVTGPRGTALPALAEAVRNRLWLERARQALRPGLAGSAALLLAAAACHLWLHPVAPGIWLPLMFLSPLLALTAVVLLRRPGLAEAVALYDDRSALKEFLVSAWEAWQTPGSRRSAGARAVLAEFEERAGDIGQPSRWPSPPRDSRRQAAQSAATWLALVAALFMLQLPGQPAPHPAAASPTAPVTAGPGQVGADTELQLATPEAGDPPTEALQAMDTPATGGMDESAREEFASDVAAIPTAEMTSGNPAQASGQQGLAAGTEPGAERQDGSPRPPDPELETRYADVARGIADHHAGSIAGDAGAELSTTAAAEPSRADTTAGGPLQPRSSSWTSRFSPAQRHWIAAYFERLEDTP